jgi:hypothetical protein
MAAGYGPDNININVFLQPVPGDGADLTTGLYLVDEAGGNALNGDRFRTYKSPTDVSDDLALAYISTAVAQALTDSFGETPKPEKILVGRVDTVGLETYADAYGLVKTAVGVAGAGFEGVAIDVRTDAEILLISAAVETDDLRIFALQSADADWLTAGYPAALSVIEGRERSIICYHDTAAEVSDLAWMCQRLSVSPDVKSAGWPAKLFTVQPNATMPTTSQQALALANEVNLGLPDGPVANWMSPGVTAANRPIEFILTTDWFKVRLQERWTALFQAVSLRGDKILVNTQGQIQIKAILDALVQEGLDKGHLDTATKADGTILPRVTPLEITDADKTAQRVRFNAELIWGTAAQAVTVNLYFSQTAS